MTEDDSEEEDENQKRSRDCTTQLSREEDLAGRQ